MNSKHRITIGLLTATVLICAGALLLMSSRHKGSQICCTALEVEFQDSLKFLTAENIKAFVDKDYGIYIGQRLDSLDLSRIENNLSKRSAISSSQAWTTQDGVLHVSIKQRAPQLRFSSGGNKGFYCDSDGYIFPLHSRYTAPVRVIEGFFPIAEASGFQGFARTEEQRTWICEMLAMDEAIKNSRSFRDLISQVIIAENGDITFRVKGHDEIFILGEAQDFNEKFDKMEKYFTHIVPGNTEKKYKTVNVKYKNQIICK